MPSGAYPACSSVQKSCPDRSEVNGLPWLLRQENPSGVRACASSALTAVPTAMNSARSEPNSLNSMSSRTPTIPSAPRTSASASMRVIASSRAWPTVPAHRRESVLRELDGAAPGTVHVPRRLRPGVALGRVEAGDVVVRPLPWRMGEQVWRPGGVLATERLEIRVDDQALPARRGLGGGRHPEPLLLRGPTVVVEGPPAVADVGMAHPGLTDLAQPDDREPRVGVEVLEGEGEDVARAGGEERLIAAPPRELLIGALGGSPAERAARGVHGLSSARRCLDVGAGKRWPGAGSNRRPSDFQTTGRCLSATPLTWARNSADRHQGAALGTHWARCPYSGDDRAAALARFLCPSRTSRPQRVGQTTRLTVPAASPRACLPCRLHGESGDHWIHHHRPGTGGVPGRTEVTPNGVIGSSAVRLVPPPSGLVSPSRPPSASTRSLSPTRPVPPPTTAPPVPSSVTVTRSRLPATSARMLTAEARACLAALVSASAALEYTAA